MQFDKLLELRNIADGAETATASETGIALPVRFLPTCDWVVYVTALDAVGGDETYVFTLEVSNLIGGTYTEIARMNWPRAHGAGRLHMSLNGDMASFYDTDSIFCRVTCTQAGATSTITYGSFLTKATNKIGLGVHQGDVVTFP